MPPAQLITHFNRFCDAPDAIPRLRKFILDLAVRGKLVRQAPSDELVVKSLHKPPEERVGAVKTGEVKARNTAPLPREDELFQVPLQWKWTRLGEIGEWGSGSTPPRGNHEFYGGDITWLKSGELNDNRSLRGSEETITEAAVNKCSFRRNKTGDVLIAMYGATIGKTAILAEPAVTNQAVCGCTPSEGVSNVFLFIFLLSQRTQFRAASEGGAQPNISKAKIVEYPFPLPPLAEQHRIVAKVDELMALCDQLEGAQTDLEQRREQLLASLLQRLNQPDGDANISQEHARFYLRNLPRLSTRPEQIVQLRQLLLNLAIRGRLVPQDSADEPSTELLNRIQLEKAKKLQSRQPKKIDSPSEVKSLFKIPEQWRWIRIEECFAVSGGLQKTPARTPKDNYFPYLGVSNVYRGRLDLDEVKQFEVFDDELERYALKKGDILVVEGNGSPSEIGRCAAWADELDKCIHQNHIIRCRPFLPDIVPYVLKYLNSPNGIEVMKNLAVTSSGLYNLSVGKIKSIVIPLPPLAEQHRIVAKVDELMAVCDELEAQLTTAQTERRRFLEAVLQEALVAAI